MRPPEGCCQTVQLRYKSVQAIVIEEIRVRIPAQIHAILEILGYRRIEDIQ